MTTDEKPPAIVTFGIPIRCGGYEVGVKMVTVIASSDDPDDDTYTIVPDEIAEQMREVSCTRTASCEEGDHTYSWPCDLVYVPRDEDSEPEEQQ